MMKIRILCVGKIKEPYLRKGIAHYEGLIRKKAQIEIIEVPDEKTPEKASEKEELLIKRTEGEKLLKHIPDDAVVYALCIDGKQLTTKQLRTQLKTAQDAGKQSFVFVIGGSLGLDDQVIKKANKKISFSAMTFPHQMMRMILLEQINRCINEE